MTTITEKLAEALRTVDEYCQAGLNSEQPNHWESALQDAMQTARATLAEYEATPRAYFPADYIREKLEKYDAEIADGTVSYPFYAGVFSQVARGMMERVS